MRRRVLIGLAVVVLALIGALVVARVRGRGPEIGKTATVERGTIERVVVASGTIEPEHLVEVRAKVSGIVERFHVDAGDRVTAGQVIAEIDRETLEAAVREARAVVHEAQVERDQAGVELRRKEDLFHRGVESADVTDRSRADHARADARLDRAGATLERLEQELAYATITAPIDGLVLRRELNPGAAVASVASVTGGTVVMTIADTSQMHLLGTVDENEIAQVRIGMPARIRTETYPERIFPGRVRKIASLGDRKENVTSFKVEVTVLDGVDALWPRMSGDADIVAEVHDSALVVPEAALLYEGNDLVVEVVEHASPARLTRRTVRLGISRADRVEILDGLAEGEVIKLQ
ncbi:MAG: efflux RND transporter periplasmic adaptor subunit [Deltaproteobacteria bacterium]|nr:efflux RND transporter periplasmic adaptor subunit [Deltaproteobacteria bacterium]MBI3388466.1 efflux RND transporter periplasmic adaptor subunit [Deltaproteobacteria bacterium]